MKDRNVCKFTALAQAHSLEIRCFVLETDPMVMTQRVQLKCNRAYLCIRGEGELRAESGVTFLRTGMPAFAFEHEWVSIVPGEYCSQRSKSMQ